ncbi:MAG: SDR family NAD(P)-dependent oxidoreductase [Steroidobacteraceae bacterium]
MQRLEQKIVVLSGAAGGIGSLVARQLRARGARVVGVDLAACPDCDESLRGDLSTVTGMQELGQSLAARRVDVLINLAGIQYFGPFDLQSAESIALGYSVNLAAPTVLARAVVPQMKTRGSGQIVNIGSVFGAIPFAHFVTYSAAKAGLRALSEGLRRELSGSGVRVTHIAPRAVKTKFNSDRVLQFARLVNMNMDPPELVAARIVATVGAPVNSVVIGFPESLFVRINALAPSLVDRALRANDRKAAAIFTQAEQAL